MEVPEIKYKDKIKLPADKTALLIVDMRNDFIKDGGSLVVESAKETVPYLKNLLGIARRNNVWDIENLIITGTVSNICVAHTAASAALRWYNIIVPANGISALTEFDQALTLRQISSLYTGTVLKSTKDIIFRLRI